MPRKLTHSIVIGWIMMLTGCTSVSWPLDNGAASAAPNPLRRIKPRIDELKPTTVWENVKEADGRVIRIAVTQWGDASDQRVFVCIPGVMSDGQSFRCMIPDLVQVGQVWTIDPKGCGLSDKPNPREVGLDAYSPEALARNVLDALRARMNGVDHRQPLQITLVGHSLGSVVVLRMFADESIRTKYADVLDRVSSLVLLTPIDVELNQVPPRFISIVRMPDWIWEAAEATGILRIVVTRALYHGVFDPSQAVPEEVDRVCGILGDPARRRAAQAMIAQAIPGTITRNTWTPDKERIARVVAGYQHVKRPTLIVWGEHDDLFPWSMGRKVSGHIPGSHFSVICDSKHDLPMERPEACAAAITNFVAANHRETRLDARTGQFAGTLAVTGASHCVEKALLSTFKSNVLP